MSQTKREQVISHIRFLRQELREMHLGINEDDLFPEPSELRGLMAQMEALLELIEVLNLYVKKMKTFKSYFLQNVLKEIYLHFQS